MSDEHGYEQLLSYFSKLEARIRKLENRHVTNNVANVTFTCSTPRHECEAKDLETEYFCVYWDTCPDKLRGINRLRCTVCGKIHEWRSK